VLAPGIASPPAVLFAAASSSFALYAIAKMLSPVRLGISIGSGEVANVSNSVMVSDDAASAEQKSRSGNVLVSSLAASASTMQNTVAPGLFPRHPDQVILAGTVDQQVRRGVMAPRRQPDRALVEDSISPSRFSSRIRKPLYSDRAEFGTNVVAVAGLFEQRHFLAGHAGDGEIRPHIVEPQDELIRGRRGTCPDRRIKGMIDHPLTEKLLERQGSPSNSK